MSKNYKSITVTKNGEYLGIVESIHNTDFNYGEFGKYRIVQDSLYTSNFNELIGKELGGGV